MKITREENAQFGQVTHLEAETPDEKKGLAHIWDYLRPLLLPEQIKFSGDHAEAGFDKLHLVYPDHE